MLTNAAQPRRPTPLRARRGPARPAPGGRGPPLRGKAAHLARVYNLGLPVPLRRVVPVEAVTVRRRDGGMMGDGGARSYSRFEAADKK